LFYRFANFSLDPGRRELRQGNRLISIEPQVFDILQFLIANRERVVSNDELIRAVWRGRIVSEATVTTRMNAVRQAVGDSGERQEVIRTIARKGYRFVGEVVEHNGAAGGAVAGSARPEPTLTDPPAVPDKPSIAVLPLVNMSGDSEQDYFADGITEDLITALSQFRWLFVIARGSSFVFKGKRIDAKQIARELGVRYLLEGSVRKSGNRLRITGQLIEASSGVHLWADRFDGSLEDIFDLQDKVTVSVVGAIAPKLEQIEIERAKRKATESLDAYDYFLRGMALLHRGDKGSIDEALNLFRQAIASDNEFASAYGMAAWCYDLRKWNSWMVDAEHETAEAGKLARQAVVLGRDDAVALCAAGFALAHVVGDLEFGAICMDRALALNPNMAAAWHFGGWLCTNLGEPEVALERLARAVRLNPVDNFPLLPMQISIAWAHFIAGRYDEAYSAGRKGIQEQPDFLPALRIFAAACAMSEHLDDARNTIAHLRELNPNFRVSNVKDAIRLRRPEDLARYEKALRKAGLPD
jgi:TolB-like protein/Tfp pilus assembly protein PilF